MIRTCCVESSLEDSSGVLGAYISSSSSLKSLDPPIGGSLSLDDRSFIDSCQLRVRPEAERLTAGSSCDDCFRRDILEDC